MVSTNFRGFSFEPSRILVMLAFTTTTLPKTSLLPAFVAGFTRVLILQRPGRVNTPVPFTSAVPTSAIVARTLVTTLFFNSHFPATASARAPLLIAVAFFMGAISKTQPARGRWRKRNWHVQLLSQ